MEADLKWLDDPRVFRVNQSAAHSDHIFYGDRMELEQGQNTLLQSLDGMWKFYYAANAQARPAQFYEETFDTAAFGRIQVPGHIEMAGYDTIHYINTMYPWEGKNYRRPAYTLTDRPEEGSFSQAAYNPVGSYRKEFDLDQGLLGKRIGICFEGVEQAMYVWLNGHFVGYAEDSFTPSEFDLTPYIREKNNVLAVEVHKRSTAAYLEDQDFFRFFGIYRSVTLFAKPQLHVEDLWAKPELNADYETGSFSLTATVSGVTQPEKMVVRIADADGMELFVQEKPAAEWHIVQEQENEKQWQVSFPAQQVGQVTAWNNRNPHLYELTMEVYGEAGQLIEIVPYRIGFRKIEIQNKVMLLNGKRLILNGVNRHEWSAKGGRCITKADMEWDMDCFLRNNINAVRTCHYPDQIPWYYMCDENGIYMMAETNLETHGSWQKGSVLDASWNVPGSFEAWKEVVVDRARTNFETFKNHTSVLFWSLGNESYAGDNIESMNTFFKEADKSRLVHYEGVVQNRSYEDTISDVESRMYATPEQIREYLEHEPKKPFLLCEYMHDMGNSLGGMQSYIDLIAQYDLYQGGFIWDYIDQAVAVKDEVSGETVLRYGGDFDDRSSDYEFSGNGIVFADRTEKPAMQEVRYYYGLYE